MWTLTGFADEISPELDEQLETLAEESISYMELRSVWNTNVLDLTDEELDMVESTAALRGIGIASIGSLIGKVPVTDPLGPHLERFRRALHAADVMQAPYIRVFSFFTKGRSRINIGKKYSTGWGSWPARRRILGSRSCTRTRRRSTATFRAVAWTY